METPDPPYLDFGLQWSLQCLGVCVLFGVDRIVWEARCGHCDKYALGPKEYAMSEIERHVWESHMTLSARLYIKGYEEAIGRHDPDPSVERVELTEAGRAYLKEREGL